MGKASEISWTDDSFNPWWGCMKVSDGCANCYALTFAKRTGHDIWGPAATTPRRLFGDKHWNQPFAWDHEAQLAGVRRRVFCSSMADVFEEHPMVVESRERLWRTIEATPHLDWLLLTKRPENVAAMLPDRYWPNVWLGTSTENQAMADLRVPQLLALRRRVPILFLSVEPQIGPVELWHWMSDAPELAEWNLAHYGSSQPLNWVICGGESGPKHRAFDEDWGRSLRDQCRMAGVAFHYKQLGGAHHAAGGCLLDGEEIKEFPTPDGVR